jgi:opacity protein-like surface antigen
VFTDCAKFDNSKIIEIWEAYMKKFLIGFVCICFFSAFAAAQDDSSRVYIGANISQSFENFSYSSFIDTFGDKVSEDGKILDGPRYDFTAGYRFGSKLRMEAQYIIVSARSFTMDKQNSDIAYKATAVFANMVIDFWDAQKSIITPFIGVGIGVGSPNLKLSVAALEEESKTNGFAWQAQGGINLKLTNWLIVNVKYSYISLPGVDSNIDESQLGDDQYLESKFKEGVQAIGAGITLLL